jgi:hypothetical protein
VSLGREWGNPAGKNKVKCVTRRRSAIPGPCVWGLSQTLRGLTLKLIC